MFENFKSGIYALCGLTVVAIATYSCNSESWSTFSTSAAVNAFSLSSGRNLSNEIPFTEVHLSQLYVHELYKFDEKNKQFLFLTDKGASFFAHSKSNHQQLWSKEPYLSRRRELQDRCSQQKPEQLIDLSRFIYDDKHKVIMCVVPKAACTTWKKYIWYFNGKVNKTDMGKVNTRKLVLKSGHLSIMSSLSKPEVFKRFLTYTSFFVTRHPFERLVSAHSSKFTERAQENHYRKILGRKVAYRQAKETLKGIKYNYTKGVGLSIIRNEAFLKLDQTEQEAALRYIETIKRGNISFHQFLKYVVRSKDRYALDVHWRPQTSLCNPCLVNYDFTVQFQDLAQDSNVLLEYLQREKPDHEKVFFDTTSHVIDRQKTYQAFQGIDNKTLIELTRLYSNDFKTLGYSSSLKDYLKDENR